MNADFCISAPIDAGIETAGLIFHKAFKMPLMLNVDILKLKQRLNNVIGNLFILRVNCPFNLLTVYNLMDNYNPCFCSGHKEVSN